MPTFQLNFLAYLLGSVHCSIGRVEQLRFCDVFNCMPVCAAFPSPCLNSFPLESQLTSQGFGWSRVVRCRVISAYGVKRCISTLCRDSGASCFVFLCVCLFGSVCVCVRACAGKSLPQVPCPRQSSMRRSFACTVAWQQLAFGPGSRMENEQSGFHGAILLARDWLRVCTLQR